ncbi:MAG: class I SAM-dependent methyltransferase [Candidatus Omnitrophica bacterium]|nr:class I SAM-dependent methyltransferase [Candidatus Omnitrophota bacterium]
MDKTIEDVRTFWNENPLFVGEIEEPVGSRAWFEKLDDIRMKDVFCENLSDWIVPGIQNMRMLDIGCGPGFWQRTLSARAKQYSGIDISPKSIELACRSQEIFGLQGKLAVGNAEGLSFPDETFDYVLSEGVIHHTPDTARCVQEIHRVLKPGGMAHVSVYYKNFLLRSGILFRAVLFLMRIFRISLKGRGREEMCKVSSLEEFVRMYDGRDNPIGKAYTREELKRMFGKFSRLQYVVYYVPMRAARLRLPLFIRRWASSTFGLMILVKAVK